MTSEHSEMNLQNVFAFRTHKFKAIGVKLDGIVQIWEEVLKQYGTGHT